MRTYHAGLLIITLFISTSSAAREQIDCKLRSEDGNIWVISTTLEDSSRKAQVASHGASAKCVAKKSCPVEEYRRTDHATVLRLDRHSTYGAIDLKEFFEMSRETLKAKYNAYLDVLGEKTVDSYQGTCTVK